MTESEPRADTLFRLLSSSRRREIIRALERRGRGKHDLAEIVDDVVDRETSRRDEQDLPPYLRGSIHNTSMQNHLPKLDSAGIVSFNESQKDLSRGPRFELADAVLEAAIAAFEEHTAEGSP